MCKTKTRKNMSKQNSRKYFGYYREIQVWWKLHHKEDNWRTRSVVEKRMFKQELWQAGCRRVSTLVNCLDHDLFYFIHIVKKFTLEKKKKRLKRMQMFFLLICWKISSLIRPYFLFINLNSSFWIFMTETGFKEEY